MTQNERPPIRRMAELVTGFVLIALSPVIGIIPGPGGIFVFAAGLWLVLRNSCKARRVFVRHKRRWPRVEAFVDKALQRKSALRRRRLEKARAEGRFAQPAR